MICSGTLFNPGSVADMAQTQTKADRKSEGEVEVEEQRSNSVCRPDDCALRIEMAVTDSISHSSLVHTYFPFWTYSRQSRILPRRGRIMTSLLVFEGSREFIYVLNVAVVRFQRGVHRR